MTAPLTPPPPPNERSSYQGGPVPPPVGAHAVGTPPGAPYGTHGDHGEQDGPGMLTEVRQAAVAVVAVALSGVLLGVLWWKLAPSVPLVGEVVGDRWLVYLKESEGEQSVGVDGTFTLLALAFGALSAVVVFLLRRRGGVPLVVALGAGGLLGSLLAWRVGIWLGPAQDVVAHAKEVGKGVTFSAPLKLGAKGALLAWPIAALVVHLGLTGLFGPRDPEPDPWPAPYGKTSA
ncbi:AAA family ATPase [Streptomyces rochei]|uniref:AAA family ATPase n=2 Tax=Streptomyces rochei group TaxID=2867164 RepID=A0AAX3ZHT1_STRRO|nr:MULTISPECIES: AAA family ATPase [Streptomyces]MCC8452689.1 AAA family ATPase [Streptomyces rochei]PVD10890.1 AAA family ATPase [Streptomyces sp. CS207]RSR99170.1 AAA family ATPase [Streptomyces sp. WAC04189]RSS11786.1 AAA family ATPase [Streptomyces sp. WAC08401]RSS29618.1 AAA family ATPase [Streptomyces sp. WAC08452]